MAKQRPPETEPNNMKPVKANVYMSQPTCTCICIYGCVHVCIHMHVCCPDGRGVALGGMVGVKHLCGSKPRSGQLQWPMFKVNGGLRWLFISRLLHPCWTPSANRHQPSSSSLSPFLPLRPQGPVLKMPVHWDPFCAVCNPTQHMRTRTHARTQAFVHK